ncbi:Benzoate 4-monooxygenase cytochrome P450 [Colletotrichum higginsianum IMI 349063]|uniref:Benzoate 4-monooxygenase cytochrome P450 n=3 Tax=Colletotrichum higginsianum TaxID=80884 RepID=A0A1B7YSF5_COLHI|nr:Benzoate 4-monooxygenase cytochrome P450 [Colletotrichum higginsianum IMI 349063]OBR14966.1 Benzoate 4-monooxygenase cytochrome P450 [Colletotrichum higginsianum IMI 349063]
MTDPYVGSHHDTAVAKGAHGQPQAVNIWLLVEFIVLLSTLYWSSVWLYRVTLHPLARYPGPKLWAASCLVQTYYAMKGEFAFKVADLHAEYGPVVRLGPSAVSYIDERAWEDIHGKHDGRKQLKKAKEFVPTSPPNGAQGLVFVRDDKAHGRIRRNFSHGFSDKALRDQEGLIGRYFDKLVARLRRSVAEDAPINMMKWYQLATFDVVGDLTYGENIGCLEDDAHELHKWIDNLYYIVKAMFLLGFMRDFLRLDQLLLVVMTSDKLPLKKNKHRTLLINKLNRRLGCTEPRSDFMEYVIRNLDTPTGISYDEMMMTSSNILMAGAETTAMTLSGATYLLCQHPEALATLTAEIRGAFASGDEIHMTTTTDRNLPYLSGVVEETLRLFPPVPTTLPRVTPPEGHFIAGRFVPGNSQVFVNQLAAYRWPAHFAESSSFRPERWLKSEVGTLYDADTKGVLKPFSTGPRNCIGKHLAYGEVRTILAKILWEFDLQLAPESDGWMESLKIYGVWEKRPLMVRFRPALRERPGTVA